MNGTHQPQQELHHIAERVAHLETAIDYQGQAISRLREEMLAGFVHTDAGFVRTDAGFVRTDVGFTRVDTNFTRVDTNFARVDAEFAHVHAEFVRVHEQLTKIRTVDFRILLSICLSTALGTMSLVVKLFGLL
ncbi:hypothetical protein Jab_1c00620 [Janthinobacterium sp. HH01]|uniref:hypothetical protein n=1 Tax=Janthinobacterium sp. HH01 TaxID=1198452 RepID=UPI0002AED5B4|nr:hypothetical protein [Janthinobacterium sp. HH01]ELX11479.1 hypothetical protein Jab_1c00620 [Janthinobacterium sp. HH01]